MLAGIDVGSTGLKLALYSLDGQRLGYAYREYSIRYDENGHATIDPTVWWDCLQACVQQLSADFEFRRLAAIGVSGANAMVLTDGENTPIFPAIMQLDKRGAQMLDQINGELGAAWIFEKTGNRCAPGYQWGPTLKWLQTYEAEKLSAVRRIYNPTSYLVARLTGAYCMDVTRAATTLLFCGEGMQWDDTLWDYFGLSKAEKPPVYAPDRLVGHTTALPLLPHGIPVAAGGIDTICATLGLTGKTTGDALIVGSVGRFAAGVTHWDSRFLNTLSWDGQRKISMTPVNNAGTALKWARKLLFSAAGDAVRYDDMNLLAEQIPSGCQGLRFFPFLNGASCPHWSETVRGTFLGMEAYHTAGHVVRSVMEGVALSLGENLQLLKQCGCDLANGLYLGGGGAKSSVWSQIFCDVFGIPLMIPQQVETETMGSAILGGLAAGKLQAQDIIHWNAVEKTLLPDAEKHALYQTLQMQFSQEYQLLNQLYQQRKKGAAQ